MAHTLKTLGRQQDAVAAYRRAAQTRPSYGDAYWSLANLKTYRFTDEELASMRAAEAAPRIALADRFHLCFALGKALEDRGEYTESFSYYERGNALKKSECRYRPEFIERNTRLQIEVCTPELFGARRGCGDPSNAPIFIVGLPRAGSTLIEQILASHSCVEGTMELSDIPRLAQSLQGRESGADRPRYPGVLAELPAADCKRFGGRYLADTALYRSGKPRFIDKMPNNFRHLGLMHLILPNAKIIDARRAPMACCFSNFKQLFASGQPFTYSLEDIARYYRTYLELMAHWDRVLPGKVLRVQHEDLVADFEPQVRRILDFCEPRVRARVSRVPQDLAPRAHGELRAGAAAHQQRRSRAMAALRALARAAGGNARGPRGGTIMTEPPAASPRRREGGRGRGTRSTGPSLAPLPRLSNPWPPLEILTGEQVERIVLAAFRVLEEAGLEIRSIAARDVYRRGGALVDDATQMVRLGRDVVEAHLKHAPASFVLHARNPERHLHVGGDVVNFGPVNGAPHINDRVHGRRYGDIESFRNILRLTHSLGVLHWQGGIVVEPVDLPVAVRHLSVYQAHIECSDIVWAARGIGGVQAQDAIAMSAIEHGCTVEELASRPTLMTVTNVNSPRRVDEEILDNIMVMARAWAVRRHHSVHAHGGDGAGDAGRSAGTADRRGARRSSRSVRCCGRARRASLEGSPPTSICGRARLPSERRSMCMR